MLQASAREISFLFFLKYCQGSDTFLAKMSDCEIVWQIDETVFDFYCNIG